MTQQKFSAATTTFKSFLFSGKVVRGHGRGGTQLGFPTANMELDAKVTEQLLPYNNFVLYGWGTVMGVPGKEKDDEDEDKKKKGPFPFAMSIGHNPHFKDLELTAEVHFIHEFAEDFYGAVVKIIVLGKIREMGAFVSLEALVDAIKSDLRIALEELLKPECERWKTNPFLTSPTETQPHFELLEG